jgi:sulfide dehydrogenase cytochrome subunit
MTQLPKIALLAALVATSTHAANTDALVKDCDDCHGRNGVSEHTDVPTIAGVSPGILGDYLLSYKDESRPCPKSKYRQGDTGRPETDMCTIAGKLSEADIEAIAKYYSAKPFVAAKQEFDAAKAGAGKKLHARDCEKCHTGNGRDADADAAILAGQWMPYLQQAMENFTSGERPMPKKMKEKVSKLNGDEIDALIHFYGSLQN